MEEAAAALESVFEGKDEPLEEALTRLGELVEGMEAEERCAYLRSVGGAGGASSREAEKLACLRAAAAAAGVASVRGPELRRGRLSPRPARRTVAEEGLPFETALQPGGSLFRPVDAVFACGHLAAILLNAPDEVFTRLGAVDTYKLVAAISWGYRDGLAGLAAWCGQRAGRLSIAEAEDVVEAGSPGVLAARQLGQSSATPRLSAALYTLQRRATPSSQLLLPRSPVCAGLRAVGDSTCRGRRRLLAGSQGRPVPARRAGRDGAHGVLPPGAGGCLCRSGRAPGAPSLPQRHSGGILAALRLAQTRVSRRYWQCAAARRRPDPRADACARSLCCPQWRCKMLPAPGSSLP